MVILNRSIFSFLFVNSSFIKRKTMVSWRENPWNIQGEAHKVLQSDSTQTIDHIQKCFRQKFQCSRRPSYWTTPFFYRWRHWSYVKSTPLFKIEPCIFFSMKLLPILRRIQRRTTQGHSSHAKYENSRKIETYRNNHFQRIHWPWFVSTYRRCSKWWPSTCKHLLIRWWKDPLTSANICGVISVHARRILSYMSSHVVGATAITRSLTKPHKK